MGILGNVAIDHDPVVQVRHRRCNVHDPAADPGHLVIFYVLGFVGYLVVIAM